MSSYQEQAAQAKELIEKATSSDLTGPDWQSNMMLCDLAEANPAM